MSKQLLTEYRTKIIEDFIIIEGFVNAIICKHYLSYLSKDFMLEVLFDELCSSGFKANILEKALTHNKDVDKPRFVADQFRKLSRYRNYFAHCNLTISEEGPIFNEDGIIFPSGRIPSPKKPNEYLDIEHIIDEFLDISNKLSKILIDIIDQMGIIGMHETETGEFIFAFESPMIEKTEPQYIGNETVIEKIISSNKKLQGTR